MPHSLCHGAGLTQLQQEYACLSRGHRVRGLHRFACHQPSLLRRLFTILLRLLLCGGLDLPPSLPQRPNVNTPGEALPGPRPASLSASDPAAQQSSTRPREDEVEGEPSAKRAKTDEGQVIPEGEWLASHPDPVKIGVQLPDYPAKPAWGCDGQKLELEVPLTLLVGTIRDRIAVRLLSPAYSCAKQC